MSDSFRPYYPEPFFTQEELRPTGREWFKHTIYFLITFVTVTIAGMLPPLGSGIAFPDPVPQNPLEWIFIVPLVYGALIVAVVTQVAANPAVILNGLAFSIPLLAILTAHEFGHYIACRIYAVKATLPYFIPAPFPFPTGTLGAVIKIQSLMPSRRAVFDIGVAGPLAGFAVIVPVALLGLATMELAPPDAVSEITFADPLLTRLLGALVGVDPTRGYANPFYTAAWFGTLMTALNLVPVGQLDGGHTVYSVFGERVHYLIGRVAFVGMLLLTILGWQFYNSPSGLLFTILLLVMLKVPHPQPLVDEPLDPLRKLVAFITLVVFALSFMPFPIQMR